ncbi:MAG: hypothetical protein AAGG08_15650 [Actinomycetota bacterium]
MGPLRPSASSTSSVPHPQRVSLRRRRSVAGALGAAGLFIAACGGDAAASGETLIETELEEQIGLGELDASCDQPDDDEIGTEFRCTATTTDGALLEFLAEFTSETEIFMSPTNVLNQDEVTFVEGQAAAVLGPEVNAEIDPSQIECPTDDVVILGGPVDEGVLDCTITDPDGTSFALTITLSNYVLREGYQDLFAQVGDPIG